MGPPVPPFLPAALIGVLVLTGCGKREPSSSPSGGAAVPAEATPAIQAGGADLTPILAELTQAVRKFSFEKQHRPASLEELVSAGYLGSLPQLADGRRFSIDPKSMQVVVTKP